MKISFPLKDYYFVRQREIAISLLRLKTAGLYTCVALAITQEEKKLLGHIDAGMKSSEISEVILENFDIFAPLKVSIINGFEKNSITGYATDIANDAIKLSGIEIQPDYPVVYGGFMTTVNLLRDHMIYCEEDSRTTSRVRIGANSSESPENLRVREFPEGTRMG